MDPSSAILMPETALTDKAKGGKHPASNGKERSGGTVIERAGSQPGRWERWYLPAQGSPEILNDEEALPKKSLRVTALPSSSLFSWPLWIAAEGESRELVKMELAGRHLLKRGMEEGLTAIPILQLGERRLVLAVATEEPFPEEIMPDGWKNAARFEISARLRCTEEKPDMILWQEQGFIQAAYYRDGQTVWFCAVRPGHCGSTLRRASARLLSEGILSHLPDTILLQGISIEARLLLTKELAANFPQASISAPQEDTPPSLPSTPIDLTPTGARQERLLKEHSDRLLSIGSVAAILYLLLLAWGSGDLLIRQSALKRIRREVVGIAAPALQAKQESERWNALRPAVDPSTYPLDLLAAAAAPTEGGKVRLTNFNLDHGHLLISGEATDVTQAYAFIEQLKKNPLLQEYDWTSGQPQLAGKNSVKFDMEGTRQSPRQNVP
ncbi:MAG: hypothetical protein K8R57_10320 [Verrucomicrobia bacterium]|nr:hypothetical protein [Verrucomicrobiota bacterium]